MEYVSVLAGAPFSDHPRCTHPALAALARMVNDAVRDDAVRSELALLAPDLIGAGRYELQGTDAVVGCCLAAAGRLPRRSARRLDRIRRRLRHADPDDIVTRLRVRARLLMLPPGMAVTSAMRLVISRLTGQTRAERDARLCALLREATAAVRGITPRTPIEPTPVGPSGG